MFALVSTKLPAQTPPSSSELTLTPTLTIDELSAQTKLPSRTIRFYQSKGALMAPTIHGRVAHYGAEHVERLRLIAQLQDRGLQMDAIRDVCQGIDRGELDLAEWLGVERELKTPWANDQPRLMTDGDLVTFAGTKRAGLIAELIRAKLVSRQRDSDVLLVHSPALLTVAMRLEAVGVPLSVAAEAGSVLSKQLERAASGLAELFVKRITDGSITAAMSSDLLTALRPVGIEAVRVLFGREMERQLRALLDSGKLARVSVRAKKK